MEIENTRVWDFDIKERKVKDHCTRQWPDGLKKYII